MKRYDDGSYSLSSHLIPESPSNTSRQAKSKGREREEGEGGGGCETCVSYREWKMKHVNNQEQGSYKERT